MVEVRLSEAVGVGASERVDSVEPKVMAVPLHSSESLVGVTIDISPFGVDEFSSCRGSVDLDSDEASLEKEVVDSKLTWDSFIAVVEDSSISSVASLDVFSVGREVFSVRGEVLLVDLEDASEGSDDFSVGGEYLSVDGENLSVDGENLSVDGENLSVFSVSLEVFSVTGKVLSVDAEDF